MWKFEVFKDPEGSWRWRLVLRNALILIESSKRYARRSDARKDAEAERAAIAVAVIEVL